MPSILSKLGIKPNPYMNAHHPGHNAIPKPTSTNTIASTNPNTHSPSVLRPRPASPRGATDFLAEARQTAGRDPVTGRRRPDFNGRTASEPEFLAERNRVVERNPLAELRQVEEEERTAYQNRAAVSRQTTGGTYDLFVQQMVARRDEENRIRAARGGVEYYAPERRMEEFYSGGVRD